MTETLLPLWQCHKQVRASKIMAVDEIAQELELEHGSVDLNNTGYFEKHDPKVGGYYVRYEDGYESWSPAEAFESGYALAHASDCATHNEPALKNSMCDCGATAD